MKKKAMDIDPCRTPLRQTTFHRWFFEQHAIPRGLPYAYLAIAAVFAIFLGYPLAVRGGWFDEMGKVLRNDNLRLVLLGSLAIGIPTIMAIRTGWRFRRLANDGVEHAGSSLASLLLLVPLATLIVAGLVFARLLGGSAGDAEVEIQIASLGLLVGGGATSILAAVISVRNQRVTEHKRMRAESDNMKRDSLERFDRSLEQLRSDSVLSQRAGLFHLEQLAKEYVPLRQQIIDIICEFIRASSDRTAAEAKNYRHEAALAAQQILTRNLRSPGDTDWLNVSVDLSRATVSDLDFGRCCLRSGTFVGTRFLGRTSFILTEFADSADFSDAIFDGPAFFEFVDVHRRADFSRAVFSADTTFAGSWFRVLLAPEAHFVCDAVMQFSDLTLACSLAGSTFNGGLKLSSKRSAVTINLERVTVGGSLDMADVKLPRSITVRGARVVHPGAVTAPDWLVIDPKSGFLSLQVEGSLVTSIAFYDHE